MNEELLIENIAQELARVYVIGWQQGRNSFSLDAELWSEEHWEMFCGEVEKVLTKSNL